jgi:hypothetical protein
MKIKMIIVLLVVLTLVNCDTSGGCNTGGRTYTKEMWGEWLRMDNGDKWYIIDDSITINGVGASITASLVNQSERVVEVTDGADGKNDTGLERLHPTCHLSFKSVYTLPLTRLR